VRCFVAVLLPEPVRARLAAAAAELRRTAGAVSWVRPENLHLTLRFLGSVEEAALGAIREALDEAGRATAPFALTLGGLGVFPTLRAPRVVWAGVRDGAASLARLHGALETALARRGVPSEGRAFHAHVTLGRVRDVRGGAALGAALAGRPPEPLGEVGVEALHLMRSELDPRGARYSVLARAALGGAGWRREEAGGPASSGWARVDLPQGGS
jgi:2'-5' RNA ligase